MRFVVGITGASGVILGFRTLKHLVEAGHDVHLIFSRDAIHTAAIEMGVEKAKPESWLASLSEEARGRVQIHKIQDFCAPVASGSFHFDAMLVIPCTMSTLAALAAGLSDNLLRRAADVALKEGRRLVVVPREAPLSTIHLENLLKLSRMGVRVVPPIPGWYTGHTTLEEAEDFIVGRSLDAAGLRLPLYSRWKEELQSPSQIFEELKS